MKKFFIAILALLFLFSPSFVSAQIDAMPAQDIAIYPPYPVPNQPFLGQSHKYSVVFRGNGEAAVSLRVAFTNQSTTEDLKELSFSVPDIKINGYVHVFEIHVLGNCIRYDQSLPREAINAGAGCVEYSEPDYYGYYGKAKYEKRGVETLGDTIKIGLSVPIKPQKSGGLFLYFKTFGFTSKDIFGTYKYNFETLKVDDQIQDLQVGITTDNEQYIKGAKGDVNYGESEIVRLTPLIETEYAAFAAYDSYISQIGNGKIIKNATDLAPMESYKVTGAFADSYSKLYAKEIVISVLVLLATVLLIAIAAKLFSKSGSSRMRDILLVGLSSFISSLFIGFLTIATLLVMKFLESGGFSYQFSSVFLLAIGLLYILVCLGLLIVPSLYIGYKKGIGRGIATFSLSLVFLFIFLIVGVLVSLSFNIAPVPIPY